MHAPFTVLFVCVGNVCRSPLAQRLLRQRLDDLLGDLRDHVAVESAGVRAMAGHPMDAMAAAELARLGGAADGFTARQLTEPIASGADLVLTANKQIRSRVLEEAPAALRRSFTIPEFAVLVAGVEADSPQELVADAARRRSAAQLEEYDVPDPIGASAEVHRDVAARIDAAVTSIARALAGTVHRDGGVAAP